MLKARLQVLFPKSSLIVVEAFARPSKTLIQELETRFPTHCITDAFGIIIHNIGYS